MQTITLVAAITMATLGTSICAGQSWRIGDDQPFPVRISTLPDGRKRSVVSHIRPTLIASEGDLYLDPDGVRGIEKSLRLRELSVGSGMLLLVQGWGVDSCGAVGNCLFWVLGANDQLLLTGRGSVVTVLKVYHHGKPSIRTAYAGDASGRTLVWYRFDGSAYRASSCAIENYGFPGQYPSHHVEYVSCAKVLGGESK